VLEACQDAADGSDHAHGVVGAGGDADQDPGQRTYGERDDAAQDHLNRSRSITEQRG
jgi:hypothetical protein